MLPESKPSYAGGPSPAAMLQKPVERGPLLAVLERIPAQGGEGMA